MDNTTLIAVLVGALVAGLALLFLVGAPSDETAVARPVASATTAASTAGTYWEPVSTAALPSPAVTAPTLVLSAPAAAPSAYPVGYEPSGPCPACMTSSAQLAAAATPALVGGCGTPIEPCGVPACGKPSCGTPSCAASPCGAPSCGVAVPTCSTGCASAPSCVPTCGVRPQINRNMPLCVDECSFIQLHASVPQPVCRSMHFEWQATKGYFLDPTAGDPIYFAPTTYFPSGEKVWVTLTLTDAQGVRYTDQVELHVNNVR